MLQAKQMPDDLQAATLRSAKQLIEGEHVTAVGFPFGIGPSVSHGVISGTEARVPSPDGERVAFQPHPVRRGRESRQLGRAAGQCRGRGDRHRHRDPSTTEKRGFSGIAFAVPIEIAAGAAGLPPF